MQKTANLQLSQLAIAAALKIGGPTFSPRARNRMICNQAPELGAMSARKAEALRSQVWPREGTKEKSSTKKVTIRFTAPPSWRNNHRPQKAYVACQCGNLFYSPVPGKNISCRCGTTLVVSA